MYTAGQQQQQPKTVAQHWNSDQHLEDGRQAIRNDNFISDLSDEADAQQHVNNNASTCVEEIVVLNGDSHDDSELHKEAFQWQSNTEGDVCGHLEQGTLAKIQASIPPESASKKSFCHIFPLQIFLIVKK